jgi:L-asparagine transporter-like permease
MMFGVGATIGTGIFFVLSEAIPLAGPAVIISFLLAALAAGLRPSATPRWPPRSP